MWHLQQPIKEQFENYAFAKEVFTPEECLRIIALADGLWEPATISAGSIDPKIRTSEIFWIRITPETQWIFERLSVVSHEVNKAHFWYDLAGFAEALQLTRYTDEQQGHYSWHQDIGSGNASLRKLSMTVNLTDPSEFEGGELEIFMQTHNHQLEITRELGSVIFFPSYEPHRVTPLTKGVRHSLVAWISGPMFR